MEEQGLYTIGELADAADVTPRTIRYYTAEGLLPGPDMRGKYAVYGEDHLRRLELIRRLKEAFLPLNEIRTRLQALTADEVRALVAVAGQLPAALGIVEPEEEPGSAADYISRVLSVRAQVSKKQAPPGGVAEAPGSYVLPPGPAESRAPEMTPPAPAVAPPRPASPPAPAAPALPVPLVPLPPGPAAPAAPAPLPKAPAPDVGEQARGPSRPAAGPGPARQLLRRLLAGEPRPTTEELAVEQKGPPSHEASLAQGAEERRKRQPVLEVSGAEALSEERETERYQRHQLAPGLELNVREPVSQGVQEFVARIITEARERFG